MAVVCVEISRRVGWVKYEAFNVKTALQWCPIAVFFCAMLVSSFRSYEYMNVPMVSLFFVFVFVVVQLYFCISEGCTLQVPHKTPFFIVPMRTL